MDGLQDGFRDLFGRLRAVDDRETEGDSTQIELARFGVGTYLIRIQTANGVSMRRVNVVK